jgi:hypothetical protein
MSMETAVCRGKLLAEPGPAIIGRYNDGLAPWMRLTTGDGAPNLLKKIGVE